MQRNGRGCLDGERENAVTGAATGIPIATAGHLKRRWDSRRAWRES